MGQRQAQQASQHRSRGHATPAGQHSGTSPAAGLVKARSIKLGPTPPCLACGRRNASAKEPPLISSVTRIYGSFLVQAPKNCACILGKEHCVNAPPRSCADFRAAQPATTCCRQPGNPLWGAHLHGIGVVHAPQDLDLSSEVTQRNFVGALEDLGGHQRAVPVGAGRGGVGGARMK